MRHGLFLISVLFFSCKNEEKPLTWKSWDVNDTPIFQAQFPLSGDPSIIKEVDKYRIYYTGFDPYRNPQGPEICQATSVDGLTWKNVTVTDRVEGRMLDTHSNGWSNAHETSYIIKRNGLYFLYFIGYQDKGGGVFGPGPVGIGLASSTDGENFTQKLSTPVIESSPSGFDRDAISSPSVIPYNDSLSMIYTGYCYTACGASVTSNLLAATSLDGITWVKKGNPIVAKQEIPWASKGVAEAGLILGSDNFYYLFMTSVDEPHVIGVAGAKRLLALGMLTHIRSSKLINCFR